MMKQIEKFLVIILMLTLISIVFHSFTPGYLSGFMVLKSMAK